MKTNKNLVLFWAAVLVISGTAIVSSQSERVVAATNIIGGQIDNVQTTETSTKKGDIQIDLTESQNEAKTILDSQNLSDQSSVSAAEASLNVSQNISPNVSSTTVKPSIKRVGEREDGDDEWEFDND